MYFRYTGEIIYDSPITKRTESQLQQKLEEELKFKPRTASMVANIGGKKVWDDMAMKMKDRRKMN